MASYYCDSVSGNDTTGTGTSGAPWATIQGSIDNITTQGTNGDVLFVRNTATYTENGLSFTTGYGGVTSDTQPFSIVGVNSSDVIDLSSKTEIDCSSQTMWASAGYDGIHLYNIYAHTAATALALIDLDNHCKFVSCDFEANSLTTNGVTGVAVDLNAQILGCYLSSHGRNAGTLQISGAGCVVGSMVINQTTSTTNNWSIECDGGTGTVISGNILYGASTAYWGVLGRAAQMLIEFNTILSSAASEKTGIELGAGMNLMSVQSNYVEGFSGTGAEGIISTSGDVLLNYVNNHYYNNTADENLSGVTVIDFGNQTGLGSSGLAKSGSATTWANRLTYYAPLDVGNMFGGGGWGGDINRDVGAVQRAVAAASTGGGEMFIGSQVNIGRVAVPY